MSTMHDVLHAIALKKHADVAAIAELAGLDETVVRDTLAHATASGRAAEAQAKFVLTPVGHMILEGQYGGRYAQARTDDAFIAAYERFEIINAELKQIVTDWQTVTIGGRQVANDHQDSDYDEGVLDRLADVHERMQRILETFAQQSPRFEIYARKLEAALDRVEDGAHEWVSDARIESYHTVWFEMHEDLLRMLARARDE